MNIVNGKKWAPIEPLSADLEKWSDPELHGLVEEWQDQRQDLEGRNEYKNFLDRLRRQWAIETGVIERLYSIDVAPTKTLIEKGFDAVLLSSNETGGQDPREVLRVIMDQHAAIEGIYDFVGGAKPLTTFYIKQLHSVLTQSQETYEAVSTLGQPLRKPMVRGAWKDDPNLVEGQIEFCPPHQVESEMHRLLDLYTQYESAGVASEVLAAWLHHRFVLIHPFIDGNGRVARCLATMVFLKPHWFPLVITRDDKVAYISALRAADNGDLHPLIKLFGDLQAKAIREAFSLSEEIVEGTAAVTEILGLVTQKWETERNRQKRQVFATADSLQTLAHQRLTDLATQINDRIREWGKGFKAVSLKAERNENRAGYYGFQIGAGAKVLNYFANRHLYQSWVAVDIFTQNRTEMVFSFHGMGNATGTLACLGVAFSKPVSGTQEPALADVRLLSEAPFVFTHTQALHEVAIRYRKWLENCIVKGLDEWRKEEGA